MQNTYITIRTYYDSINAHLDKMKLNSAGLDCILLDEHTNVLRSVWAIVLIRLQVRVSDVDLAEQILCSDTPAEIDEAELTRQALDTGSNIHDLF